MSLFNRFFKRDSGYEAKAQAMMEELAKKPMFKYNMLEPFSAVDMETVFSAGAESIFGRWRLLCENDEFGFFGFTPRLLKFVSGEHVLRRSKTKPSEFSYFGESRQLSCLVGNYLLQTDRKITGRPILLCKNVFSGAISQPEVFRFAAGYGGHGTTCDYINKIKVIGDTAVFEIGRYHGAFNNIDANYTGKSDYELWVSYTDDGLVCKSMLVPMERAAEAGYNAYSEIGMALHISRDSSAAANLAISTILVARKIQEASATSFLCKTNVSCCDTVVFACFILRAFCLMSTNNKEAAMEFSDSYIPRIVTGIKYLYPECSSIANELFDNRALLYDKAFASGKGIDDKCQALLHAFETVLKNDAMTETYMPLDEHAPIPLLADGILGDAKCREEVQRFFEVLPDLVSPYYQQVKQELSQKSS